eukprot:TRINITY_DN19523_c0_g1_i1.p1 TRINITY_DN19523_c0_g1~~TRINITY_DN19523_c0_g1_i1.p1  ORF type:complete len:178 (-),score=55.72 TRINITY_DN19523_c0_g1_i1:150-683(-)
MEALGKRIEYCPMCGLPPEYCEFGPNFDKCKPWLIENHPDLYPDLGKEPAEGAEGEEDKKSSSKRGGKGLVRPDNDGEKMLPGGKVKKKEKPIVHIERVQRNKRKYVTIVMGLDKFGIKLSDASKLFAKKFSCGASVIKGEGEEEIDIQGDVVDDLVDYLEEKWQINDDSIDIKLGK